MLNELLPADVETEPKKIKKRLPTKISTLLTSNYCPDLDLTAEINAERLNYYQGQIGVCGGFVSLVN